VPTLTRPSYPDASGVHRVSLNPCFPITPYICLECWNALDDATAYCRRCGHASSCFPYEEIAGQMCLRHPSSPAAQLCNYCGRPFCDPCLETNKGSILTMGAYSYHCLLCLAEIARLKEEWPNRDLRFCGRHPDVPVQGQCVGCQNGTCEFCTYYPVRGVFGKRVTEVPHCFSCVRHKIWDHKIRHCIVKRFVGSPGWRGYVF
jgi:hypothetical protein